MRIDSGNIGMDSARLYRSTKTLSKSVETGVSANLSTGSQLTRSFSGLLYKEDYVEKEGSLSNFGLDDRLEAKEGDAENPLLSTMEKLGSKTKTKIYDIPKKSRDVESEFQRMQQKFIQNILELLFRHRKKSSKCTDNSSSEEGAENTQIEAVSHYESVQQTTNFTSVYQEFECTSFSATGTVHTDDGRDININLNITMSSSFTSFFSESVSEIISRPIDPLVINMHDVPKGLSDLSFFFDLDCDGNEEYISGLKEGSGFLALDKNNDGKINDGSELFGTSSGDGFKDLALYDLDGNGWIDENDDIFNLLKVWAKDLEGNDILYSLKDLDIGAINLGSADTRFTYTKENSREVTGMVRRTGIFLYESGEVGTVQHLDLAT